MSKNYKFNPQMYKTVAKNIRFYRKKKSMSIDELSTYAQINKEYLQKFEFADTNMSISIYDLYKISVILETSIDKFFDEKNANDCS